MRPRLLWFVLCGVCGCLPVPTPAPKETTLKLMGDAAPQIGSEQTPTFETFVVGSWRSGSGMDPDQAKQMGVPDLGGFTEGIETYTFKTDKTFTLTQGKRNFVIGGTWQINGESLLLSYDTLDGKSISQAKADMQKAADTGAPAAIGNEIIMDWITEDLVKLTMWRIAPDKRHLYCNTGIAAMTGESTPAQLASGAMLERLAPEK